MPIRKGEESRDRNRHLKVVVSKRERADIETRAAATGLSVSAYLRNLGLGFQPHSTLDQEAILALLKPNLNTTFRELVDLKKESAKFMSAWHYALGGRGAF